MADSPNTNIRALGLCSGGLDSILSGLVLLKQGITVEWISFETPFFSADKARKASQITGIPLRVEIITDTYMKMLRNPPVGYGQYMNPCMDCHALMFRLAGRILVSERFDFLFSGEVLGQRPMSQTKPSLRYVEKHSGLQGLILRPLSAKLLPETIPEQRGWVDRARLLDFSGRSRKPQIQLAAQWDVNEYPAPAGGCLLADKGFSRRLKDLFDHQESCREAELELLKYGRHFRVNPQTKMVVGRSQADNEQLLRCYDSRKDTCIKVKKHPGPVAIIPNGSSDEGVIVLAASLAVGYSKASNERPTKVRVVSPQGKETLTVMGIPAADLQHLLI
jgi:tRNA U34 2-thiouridine synthase MnmA/TrmU